MVTSPLTALLQPALTIIRWAASQYVLYTYMRPIVTAEVAWSVGLSVTIVRTAKATEPIEMTFRSWTRVGPRNYVLDGGGSRSSMGREERPIVNYNYNSYLYCAPYKLTEGA